MFDRLGFLPRDGETKEEYQNRLASRELLFSKENYHRLAVLLKEKRTEELYGFSPEAIWGFFSKKKLPIWYGAMTWVMEDDTPIIQFRKKKLFGYSLEEVASHEAVHAFRSDFCGDRFEEIFAYQTSKNRLRRKIGPLFRSPWQIRGFFLTLFVPWFSAPSYLFMSYMIPFGYLAIQWFRLQSDYKLFEKALVSVKAHFPKSPNPLAILVRMSEEEILLFAKGLGIKEYIEKMEKNSLRWQQIIASCY